jgi:hypothetical protein
MSPGWFLTNSLESANLLDIISNPGIYQNLALLIIEGFIGGLDRAIVELDNKILRDFAMLMKKQNKWVEAIKLWEVAAKKDDPISCVELAKYFEHREMALLAASDWVDKAIGIINRTEGTEKTMEELLHRKIRLESKIRSNYEKR